MDVSEKQRMFLVLLVALLFVLLAIIPVAVQAGQIGFCYGRNADNLPASSQVAQFLVNQSIRKVRIYDYDQTVIQAFANTKIELMISIPNSALQSFQTENQADAWVNSFLAPLVGSTNITAIAVGAEAVTNQPDVAALILPAMMNIHTGLTKAKLADQITVTTPNSMAVLQTSFPPSAGAFNDTFATSFLKPVLDYLQKIGSFFMVNAYPFLAYSADPQGVPLDYALFESKQVVIDPITNLQYSSLFDAQLDAVYYAMEAMGHQELGIVISETGWPTKGGAEETGANVQNAATYNNNLIAHILNSNGTPHRPGRSIDAYIFSLFNEDLKTGAESERYWGVYNADESPVYHLDLTGLEKGAPQSFNGTGSTWCIAVPEASNSSLAAGLDWACGKGNADCRPLQPGQACYQPNTYQNHASYAYNSYYQRSGDNPAACNFSGTAMKTSNDPSYGSCRFSSDAINGSTSSNANDSTSSNVNGSASSAYHMVQHSDWRVLVIALVFSL